VAEDTRNIAACVFVKGKSVEWFETNDPSKKQIKEQIEERLREKSRKTDKGRHTAK
jgi:hypothetical protein